MAIPLFGYTPRGVQVNTVTRVPTMTEIVLEGYHEGARLGNQNLLQAKKHTQDQRALDQRLAHDTAMQGRREAFTLDVAETRRDFTTAEREATESYQANRDVQIGNTIPLTGEQAQEYRDLLGDAAVDAGMTVGADGQRYSTPALTRAWMDERALQAEAPTGAGAMQRALAEEAGAYEIVAGIDDARSDKLYSREEYKVVNTQLEMFLAKARNDAIGEDATPKEKYNAALVQYGFANITELAPNGSRDILLGEDRRRAIDVLAKVAAGMPIDKNEQRWVTTLSPESFIDGRGVGAATREALRADLAGGNQELAERFLAKILDVKDSTRIGQYFEGKAVQLLDSTADINKRMEKDGDFAVAAQLMSTWGNEDNLAQHVIGLGGYRTVKDDYLNPGVLEYLREFDPINFGNLTVDWMEANAGLGSPLTSEPLEEAPYYVGAPTDADSVAPTTLPPGSPADSARSVRVLGGESGLEGLGRGDVTPAGAQPLDVAPEADILTTRAENYTRFYDSFMYKLNAGIPMKELNDLIIEISNPEVSLDALRQELNDIKMLLAENNVNEFNSQHLTVFENMINIVELTGGFDPVVAEIITQAFNKATGDFYNTP